MKPLAVRVLGTPEACLGDRPLSFQTRKVLALLIYLGVERRMHSRESLMALLWPESPSGSAAASLRVTLSRLRRSLSEAGDALVAEAGLVSLDASFPIDLDLDWLAAAAQPETSLDKLKPILEIDRGEFLEGFTLPDAPEFDNWAAVQREAGQRQVETVYDRLSQRLLATHSSAAAVETAVRWVARAPLSEQAYRRLMAAQALSGQRSAALQTYKKLQAVLQKELGLEPERETAVLADNISQGYLEAELPVSPYAAGPGPIGSERRQLPLTGRSGEHSRLVDSFHRAGQAGTQVLVLIGAA